MASVHSIKSSDIPPNETCSICFGPLADGGRQIVQHGMAAHIFHRDCLRQWIMVKAICPLCRISIDGSSLLSHWDRLKMTAEKIKKIVIGEVFLALGATVVGGIIGSPTILGVFSYRITGSLSVGVGVWIGTSSVFRRALNQVAH